MNTDSRRSIAGLEGGDLETLRAVPKSDLHRHGDMGCSQASPAAVRPV